MGGGGQSFGQPYQTGGFFGSPTNMNVSQGSYGGGYGIGGLTGGPGAFSTPGFGGFGGYGGYGGYGGFGGPPVQPFNPYSFSYREPGTTGADLDRTTRDYTNTFNAFRGMGGTEEEFVEGDVFKGYQNQLLDQIGTLSDEDRLRSDLDTQMARAREGGIYAPSSQRIADAIQRRLNRLQMTPRRQETYMGGPSSMGRRQSFPQMGFGTYAPTPSFGLPSLMPGYGSVPSRYGSSMFGFVPSYYSRDYVLPGGLYSTTPGAYRYTGVAAPEGGQVGGQTTQEGVVVNQDVGRSPSEIAEEAGGPGNHGGIAGLTQNPDGSYTYRVDSATAQELGISQEMNFPAGFDISQLRGPNPNVSTETDTPQSTPPPEDDPEAGGAPETETAQPESYPADGTQDLGVFGMDNQALTKQYTAELNAYTASGKTEQDFVNSPRFMEFENALTRSYINQPLGEVEKEAIRQRERADAGGVYAGSAGRIADSLEAYVNALG